MHKPFTYALITPARNEAQYIERTIQSVISQTLLPVKWVIVNDGSTDGTADIVSKYVASHSWIEIIEMPPREERHFAGKAFAVSAGQRRLVGLNYDAIGNLDADVSFESDYFEFLMQKFAENPKLGVAGTSFVEGELRYNYELVGIEHVAGMCQIFRRECFEAIGGYSAVKTGGIDLMAVLSARAKGWETRTFLEKSFVHHRTQGGALHTGLRGRWYMGRKDYLLGNHPLWECLRSIYQMKNKPYIVGGALVLTAYTWCAVLGVERTMPRDLLMLRQSEQMKRLKLLVRRRIGLATTTA